MAMKPHTALLGVLTLLWLVLIMSSLSHRECNIFSSHLILGKEKREVMPDTEAASSHKREMKGVIFLCISQLNSCQMQIWNWVFGVWVFVSGLRVCLEFFNLTLQSGLCQLKKYPNYLLSKIFQSLVTLFFCSQNWVLYHPPFHSQNNRYIIFKTIHSMQIPPGGWR